MNLKNYSRTEKEQLFIKKMIELQRLWGNPIDNDWDFVKEGTDEEMDKMLDNVMGQLRFEKTVGLFGKVIRYALTCFIVLGVIGLLVFGIRQLFG